MRSWCLQYSFALTQVELFHCLCLLTLYKYAASCCQGYFEIHAIYQKHDWTCFYSGSLLFQTTARCGGTDGKVCPGSHRKPLWLLELARITCCTILTLSPMTPLFARLLQSNMGTYFKVAHLAPASDIGLINSSDEALQMYIALGNSSLECKGYTIFFQLYT